jgi:hypothetical protein
LKVDFVGKIAFSDQENRTKQIGGNYMVFYKSRYAFKIDFQINPDDSLWLEARTWLSINPFDSLACIHEGNVILYFKNIDEFSLEFVKNWQLLRQSVEAKKNVRKARKSVS